MPKKSAIPPYELASMATHDQATCDMWQPEIKKKNTLKLN